MNIGTLLIASAVAFVGYQYLTNKNNVATANAPAPPTTVGGIINSDINTAGLFFGINNASTTPAATANTGSGVLANNGATVTTGTNVFVPQQKILPVIQQPVTVQTTSSINQ